MTVTPPPLKAAKPHKRWFQHPLAIVGFVIAGLLSLVLILVALGVAYAFTGKDFAVSPAQRQSLFTIEEAAKSWELTPNSANETLTAKRFLDKAITIDYIYDDPIVDEIYLNSTINVEPTLEDSKMGFSIDWGIFKMGTKANPNAEIKLTKQDHLFSWGDESHFVFQETEGEVYGFAFITRQGKRTFFVDGWGLILTDPDEIDSTLSPVLERFEKTTF